MKNIDIIAEEVVSVAPVLLFVLFNNYSMYLIYFLSFHFENEITLLKIVHVRRFFSWMNIFSYCFADVESKVCLCFNVFQANLRFY